ncbi:hypothetical protein [Priestia megaterium]|uniref:hypothetical protein n=1 Tax=Priestia megaterium TaxID=1404 RepID=UPI00207AFF34|nr:hypothetical protein [Priestia megaterium]USL32936.1 hypothetical protein LIT30_12305 [Priestia megaterium]
MSTYSIEQSAENIYHPKTKEYFREVLQSYINGSYRSAVVMLYSVVMCDLIYKLKDLKELYEDKTAESILNQIEKEQENETKKGSWETTLIEEVKKRTFLLEPADQISLDALRLHRHLSAHPVLTQQDLLSAPNKETVRALMRNMLDGLLTKNPVISKKVFDMLLEDLEQHKDFFTDDLSLLNYLESRYLKNTNEHAINNIFQSLWAVTFNCSSDPCKLNRNINFRTLNVLYTRNRTHLIKYMSENPIPFNKFAEDEKQILSKLTEFLGNNQEVYKVFEEHTRTKLQQKIKERWSLKIKSPFLRESMEEHFDYLIDKMHDLEHGYFEEKFSQYYTLVDRDERKLLLKWAVENDCVNKYYKLLITQYTYSFDFESARINFGIFIEDNLKHFNREHFLSLYDGINRNRQCHGSKYSQGDNTIVKRYSDLKLGADFDYKGKYTKVSFREK